MLYATKCWILDALMQTSDASCHSQWKNITEILQSSNSL